MKDWFIWLLAAAAIGGVGAFAFFGTDAVADILRQLRFTITLNLRIPFP